MLQRRRPITGVRLMTKQPAASSSLASICIMLTFCYLHDAQGGWQYLVLAQVFVNIVGGIPAYSSIVTKASKVMHKSKATAANKKSL